MTTIYHVFRGTDIELDKELGTIAIINNTVTSDPTMAKKDVYTFQEAIALWQAIATACYNIGKSKPKPKPEPVPVADVDWLGG